MIQVQGLTKQYGMFTAVDNVSFEVPEGAILGFLGPNGAGKTTTMRMLTCYMPATAGTAKVAGYDIFEDSLMVRRNVGYMPENVPMYTDMTARSYLHFVAEVKGIPARERKAAVGRAIERVGLESMAERYIRNLSKGYKQRVGLAQAIINEPPVLILDEPTSGLDPRQIIDIRNLIKSLAETSTIILSTHILPEVTATCTKVAIINRGRIARFGDIDALMSDESEGMTIQLTAEAPEGDLVSHLEQVPGVQQVSRRLPSQGSRHHLQIQAKPGKDPRQAISTLIVNMNWPLLDLHAKDVTLEDIFVQIVSAEEHEQRQIGASDDIHETEAGDIDEVLEDMDEEEEE